jgi:hypothetical protein
MDDDDAELLAKPTSMLFFEPAKVWDSTKIEAWADGNWLIFTDKSRSRVLNSPRLRRVELNIPYHYKGYRPPKPPPTPDPLDHPPQDNYTAFRARRRIYGDRKVDSSRKQLSDIVQTVKKADDQSMRYFRGDDPSRNPFRTSIMIVNEKRLQDLKPVEPSAGPTASPRNLPSLFKRSIKRAKKKPVWPPDDYYEWNCQP